MSERIQIFRSPESEAQYVVAYDAMLKCWTTPYDDLHIPTRFGDTHVIANGSPSASSVVLFHSAGSGAVQWYRNVGPLSQRYRTYAVDVIGDVNRSISTRQLCKRQDFVDWVLDLFNTLQIDRAYIVGNSFGGFLAFNTALYIPQRVKRIVLISPAATFVQMWPFYWHLAFPYKLGYMFGSRRVILSGFNWIWQGFPKDACFAQHSELSRLTGFPVNQLRPPVYRDEEIRQVQTPTLLLIGDHEVIYKPERAIRRAVHLMSNLQAEIVPNANHNAQVTAAEVVNEKIMDFLCEP